MSTTQPSSPPGTCIRLEPGRVLTRTDGPVVRCRSGALWITDAEGTDLILRAGEELRVSGRAVIEALEPAEVQVVPPAPAPAAIPWLALSLHLARR